MAPSVPVLHDSPGGQIEHPAQGIIIGEAGLVFGDLPELPVGCPSLNVLDAATRLALNCASADDCTGRFHCVDYFLF